MIFNLRNNRDLILVLIILFVFNLIEYLIPSKTTSVSAYVIGALTFICTIEIFQYLIKPYTTKKVHNITFTIFIIGLLLIFIFARDFIGRPYIYGISAGFIIAIILKLVRKKTE